MATELELKERQKMFLGTLLKIKRANIEKKQDVYGLSDALENAVLGMEEEDVAVVEKITGVKVWE